MLHEKMIQVHIYLWTGSSRGQDRTSASWIRRRNPKVFGCCDLLGKQEIQLPPTDL
jgi:hypothetical protein